MHTSHDIAGVLQADDIDFAAYLHDTEPAEKLRRAVDYLPDVLRLLATREERPTHPMLPFAGARVGFAPGEVTLWAGFNGSGKSMLTGQVLTGIAQAGERICIASFEMKPAKTLARINRQVFRSAQPTEEQVLEFFHTTDGAIWLYDQQGTVQPQRMLAVIRHCAEKLGCQHIVIDSLMKCVKGDDDYNGQKDFVDALTAAARDHNIHIHLVAHLRKGEGDERLPTRMDIKGSGSQGHRTKSREFPIT